MARPKGAKSKRTFPAEELAKSLGIDPFRVLLHASVGDWKALGYPSEYETKYTKDGVPYEDRIVTIDHRIQAASQASKYLYPQKKAIQLEVADMSDEELAAEAERRLEEDGTALTGAVLPVHKPS